MSDLPVLSRESRLAPRYSVPAIEKAFSVVELLASFSEGLTLQEISGKLGRSKGELYRILSALQSNDLIRRDHGTDRHFLTSRILEMAHRHPPTDGLLRTAHPVMVRLALWAEQSCHLAVLHGNKILIIHTAHSTRPIQYNVKLGSGFSVLEASSGIVILGHASDDVRAEALAGVNEAARKGYERRFMSVRATGRERIASAIVPGITNLSAPVFGEGRQIRAALTLPFLPQNNSAVTIDEAETALLEAAAEISTSLATTVRESSS